MTLKGIVFHPYLTGQPYRVAALDKALEHICRHAGLWLATGTDIMRHYRAQVAATTAIVGPAQAQR